VWLEREVYPSDELLSLKARLMELAGVTEGQIVGTEVVKAKEETVDREHLAVNELIVFKQAAVDEIDGQLDNGKFHLVDSVWMELCQQLKVVEENRTKIAALEQKLTDGFSSNADQSTLEGLVTEYESQLQI
jgi:hypothetical protein